MRTPGRALHNALGERRINARVEMEYRQLIISGVKRSARSSGNTGKKKKKDNPKPQERY